MSERDCREVAASFTRANRIDEIGRATQLVREFGAQHRLAPEIIHDFGVAFDAAVTPWCPGQAETG
jgi:hypothetical protein